MLRLLWVLEEARNVPTMDDSLHKLPLGADYLHEARSNGCIGRPTVIYYA